jgi:hypothetical protein
LVDYLLPASAGQTMTVVLETNNTSNYFNVLAPGLIEAIFIGSTSGNRFEGSLPASGEYQVRVYLMRNAARRDESASFSLKIGIGANDAAAPTRDPDFADGLSGGPDFWEVSGLSKGSALNVRSGPSTNDPVIMQFTIGTVLRNLGCAMSGDQRWCEVALPDNPDTHGWVAGRYLRESGYVEPAGARSEDATVGDTGFHATGQIPCSIKAGQPTGSCDFGVVRKGSGTAIVTIFKTGGEERVIHFQSGEPLSVEGGGGALEWERAEDLTILRLGNAERYEIPDAVIFGG